MNRLTKILATLTLTAAPFAHAAPVIDFSENHQNDFTDTLYAFQEKAILTQLFTNYVKDEAQCPAEDASGGPVEAILSQVQIVRGHFASLTEDEVVVVFKSVACPGSHAGEHANIALVRGTTVLDARQDLSSASLEKVLDVNGDGLSEVITSFSYSGQGYTQLTADTVTFKGGKITKMNYVTGVVHTDDCNVTDDGKGHEYAAVFFPFNSAPPRVAEKNYVKACGADNSTFKFSSNGVLDGI